MGSTTFDYIGMIADCGSLLNTRPTVFDRAWRAVYVKGPDDYMLADVRPVSVGTEGKPVEREMPDWADKRLKELRKDPEFAAYLNIQGWLAHRSDAWIDIYPTLDKTNMPPVALREAGLPQMVISAVLDAHNAAKGPIPPRPCYQAIYDAVARGRKPSTCFDTGQPMTVSAEDQYGRWCQSCCDAGNVEPCVSILNHTTT